MITITPNVPPPSAIGSHNLKFPPPQTTQKYPLPQRPQFFQPFRNYKQAGGNNPLIFDPEFDGKRLRKSAMRKTVDYNASIIKHLEQRVWQRDYRDRRGLQPDSMYTPELLPPSAYENNPINAVTTRFVKTATNKMRCPIFCMAWTPEGRRLVTGASSGEFTLWNGLTFNFETILQAHDTPVRTMVWSHNELWMVTADHTGYVKYWQSNMNNVKMFLAHQEAIRGLSFSPNDSKFVSCSDDGTLKIWDFYRCQEERILRGHGADVKCAHWHPHKGLVISGSKDNQQPVKLWDPKTGTSLATIHAHKSTVMDIKWNNNGNWFITASRDHLLKLYDVRNLNNEVQVFRGHKKEASSVAWHPVHQGLFSSGGSDGAILFWLVGAEKEVGAIEQAHDSIVWTLAWHPLGHILCSGSNDHTSKFWTRNRPGDSMKDKYNLNLLPPGAVGNDDIEIGEECVGSSAQAFTEIPGMGPEDKIDNEDPLPGLQTGIIPGLEDDLPEILLNEDKNKTTAKKVPFSKPIPKQFVAQWNDSVLVESDDESMDVLDPMFLINKLIETQPGARPIKELEGMVEAIYIYGKAIRIEPDSALAKVVCEGGEKLMKYVNSGKVHELRDVLPHYETEEGEMMPNIESESEDEEEHGMEYVLDANCPPSFMAAASPVVIPSSGPIPLTSLKVFAPGNAISLAAVLGNNDMSPKLSGGSNIGNFRSGGGFNSKSGLSGNFSGPSSSNKGGGFGSPSGFSRDGSTRSRSRFNDNFDKRSDEDFNDNDRNRYDDDRNRYNDNNRNRFNDRFNDNDRDRFNDNDRNRFNDDSRNRFDDNERNQFDERNRFNDNDWNRTDDRNRFNDNMSRNRFMDDDCNRFNDNERNRFNENDRNRFNDNNRFNDMDCNRFMNDDRDDRNRFNDNDRNRFNDGGGGRFNDVDRNRFNDDDRDDRNRFQDNDRNRFNDNDRNRFNDGGRFNDDGNSRFNNSGRFNDDNNSRFNDRNMHDDDRSDRNFGDDKRGGFNDDFGNDNDDMGSDDGYKSSAGNKKRRRRGGGRPGGRGFSRGGGGGRGRGGGAKRGRGKN